MSLAEKKCVPCEGGTQPLSSGQANEYYTELDKEWQLKDQQLSRQFTFQNFKESMAFVNKVADVAEKEGHHPDMYIFYDKVRLELTTHAIGGLSVNDFIVAAKVDRLS